MAKATIVVIGTFKDGYDQYFADYSRKVRSLLESAGASVVRRQRVESTIYGDRDASLVMVIDMPDEEIAAAFFHEPAYSELIPLRDRVFSCFEMFLAKYGEI